MPGAAVALSLALSMAACDTAPKANIDGVIEEWSSETAVVADGHSISFRFKTPGDPQALQASDHPVEIYLDADGDPATGRTSRAKPVNKLGVDVEIVFSPRGKDGKPGRGVAVRAVGKDGAVRTIPNEASGLVFSPTYASNWYEMRIDRGVLSAAGVKPGSRVTGMLVTLDEEGKIDGYADPFEVALPPAATTPRLATVDIPMKPAEAIRIVSFNIEKSKPVTAPDAFARVLYLLNPDVIILQEWDQGDAAAMDAWFKEHLGGMDVQWKARKTEETGVAIVTHLPITALPPDTLWMSDGSDKPRLVRVATASVLTPGGPISISSVHLKCCGGASGREETLRQGEARAINGMLAAIEGPKIIAGDFNLVGTRVPLDLMRAGLDHGVDLAIAEPTALGQDLKVTWREWTTEFSPGRLDYFLYSPSSVRPVHSFVFDTSVLADESLARMGLDRADGQQSDHLPVVVDVVVKP